MLKYTQKNCTCCPRLECDTPAVAAKGLFMSWRGVGCPQTKMTQIRKFWHQADIFQGRWAVSLTCRFLYGRRHPPEQVPRSYDWLAEKKDKKVALATTLAHYLLSHEDVRFTRLTSRTTTFRRGCQERRGCRRDDVRCPLTVNAKPCSTKTRHFIAVCQELA